ncbi:MAG TPA: hypothetical protein VGC10_02215 [Sphingomonas sp.]
MHSHGWPTRRTTFLDVSEAFRYAAGMTTAETYRALAAAQRDAAAKTDLLNRRIMHERSAMSWEAMAEAAEDTIERSIVNAAAKAAR